MKKIAFLLSIILFSQQMMAESYEDFEPEEEGRLVNKMRLFGLSPSGSISDLPSATSKRATGTNSPKTVEDLTSMGYGVEFATEVFLNDNIATELAVGIGAYKTTKLEAPLFNYTDDKNASEAANIYTAPISLLLKYFIAPFGAISPYVGAGYHYTILFSRSDDYKLSNSHGMVLQAGVDFMTKSEVVYSFDVKKYVMSPKIKYRAAVIPAEPEGKLKSFDPLMFSIGVGFKL